jgi:hypothetical protein
VSDALIAPAAVAGLIALTLVALATDPPTPARAAIVALFLLAGPGLALLPLVFPRRPREVLVLALPVGMAVTVVVATAIMYAVGLSELAALRALVGICAVGGAAQVVLHRST